MVTRKQHHIFIWSTYNETVPLILPANKTEPIFLFGLPANKTAYSKAVVNTFQGYL